jgi:hypothetical protein
MVLANDVVELLWPEPVGERVRRVFLEACGGEQARAARFGARAHRHAPSLPGHDQGMVFATLIR